MATYTISTDDAQEAGITAARTLYNQYNPDQTPFDTNDAYIQFVMASAFKSYEEQAQAGGA